jgi:hypothetical protein
MVKPEGVNCNEMGQGHVLLFLVFGIEIAESEASSLRHNTALPDMEMRLCCQSNGNVTHPALQPARQLLQISVQRKFDLL